VGAVVAIVAIATVVVIHGRGAWGAFFYFASAGASPLLPRERTIALISGTGIVAGIATFAVSGDPGGSLLQGVSVAVVGLLVFTVNEARRANRALAEARDELARLAVADERARISRDLHDTLGHSLALITLKSELAGKLLPAEPERARLEIADVERAARDALASVRETVTGVARPTLDGELAIARRTLEAANIELDVATLPEALPEAVDAVLAWTIREAVTNAVRHSGARRLRIRIDRDTAWATADVIDDGKGQATGADEASAGGGLRGLAERISALGGRFEAGPAAGGGFRLAVRLPLDPAGGAA
jgi:two-component system sensor histidine kinase DesK